MSKIPDEQLADEIITRLNALLTDRVWGERFRSVLGKMILARVDVGDVFAEGHPTAQCGPDHTFSVVGLINAIVGLRKDGSGSGYVAAEICCCDEHVIHRFLRSDKEPQA